MKLKRHNQILAGVLLVQVVLGVVVFWPREPGVVQSEPIFPDLEAGDIVDLTIVDASGNVLHLKRVAEDWVLPEADDYPVQGENVTSVLEKLTALTTGRLVTRTDASHKQLQVSEDDFMRRIQFETSEGETHTLYLGSSPRYGATHFRVAGEDETYLTSDLSTYDVNAMANSWINAAYLDLTVADVQKMTLENANGTFVFTREGTGGDEGGEIDQWTMEGLGEDEILAETRVTAAIRQAASLQMTTPLGKEEKPEYGLDEPSAVVTLETADKTVTLRVGAQDPDDGSYVVHASESPYYVRAADFSVKALVENTRQDFLELPPTPTPEGGGDAS